MTDAVATGVVSWAFFFATVLKKQMTPKGSWLFVFKFYFQKFYVLSILLQR